MFKFKIEWLNDDTERKETAEGIINGENYIEVIKNLISWYGEENIIDILSLHKLEECLEKEEIMEIFTEEG
jgi:hypothetical protein